VVLSRRAAAFLLATGAFQWVIWPTFLRNIWRDDRSFDGGSPTGFLVVHAVLTAVSLALGTGVLAVGWRGLRARR
jgi:cytochrome b